MDGILALNPTDQSTRNQNIPVRSKGLGGASARKPLARIENTSQKAVSFERGALKPSSKLGKNVQSNGTKGNTPAPRSAKTNKSSTNKKKTASTVSFKIFADEAETEDDEIEYMPPGDKEETEFLMPAYLQKALNVKPTYNIELPKYALSDEVLHRFEKSIIEEVDKETKRILGETMEDEDFEGSILDHLSSMPFVPDDEEILRQLETDETFSLETLDREIRKAELDPPHL